MSNHLALTEKYSDKILLISNIEIKQLIVVLRQSNCWNNSIEVIRSVEHTCVHGRALKNNTHVTVYHDSSRHVIAAQEVYFFECSDYPTKSTRYVIVFHPEDVSVLRASESTTAGRNSAHHNLQPFTNHIPTTTKSLTSNTKPNSLSRCLSTPSSRRTLLSSRKRQQQ